MQLSNSQERIQRHSIMSALAQRDGEAEADYLARVLPVWNALPMFQQQWFADFGAGLQQRLSAQHKAQQGAG